MQGNKVYLFVAMHTTAGISGSNFTRNTLAMHTTRIVIPPFASTQARYFDFSDLQRRKFVQPNRLFKSVFRLFRSHLVIKILATVIPLIYCGLNNFSMYVTPLFCVTLSLSGGRGFLTYRLFNFHAFSIKIGLIYILMELFRT